MRRILLIVIFISVLVSVAPLQAQNETIPVQPCLTLYGQPVSMEYFPESSFRMWVKKDDPAQFLELEAVNRIKFAGYAPAGYENLEWYGSTYGWRGVNMLEWTDRGLLLFYDKPLEDDSKQIVARAEIRGYPPTDSYQVYVTTIVKSGEGRFYAYHVPLDPSGNAVDDICVFVIEEREFLLAMGWEFEH